MGGGQAIRLPQSLPQEAQTSPEEHKTKAKDQQEKKEMTSFIDNLPEQPFTPQERENLLRNQRQCRLTRQDGEKGHTAVLGPVHVQQGQKKKLTPQQKKRGQEKDPGQKREPHFRLQWCQVCGASHRT